MEISVLLGLFTLHKQEEFISLINIYLGTYLHLKTYTFFVIIIAIIP